jgi:DNA repair protein RadC
MKKVAEIKISYRTPKTVLEQPFIKCAEEAYNVLLPHFNPKTIGLQEQFIICYLARNNQVKGIYSGFTGGISSTTADMRIILGIALKSGSTSIIVSHNHPSGNLKASHSDIELTKKLKEACTTMDLVLLDHLIISPFGAYSSMCDEGLL